MADILKGEHIKIDTPTLKKYIGRKVKYLLNGDGGLYPRYGEITEIVRRQVDFGNQEWHFIDRITEIVLID